MDLKAPISRKFRLDMVYILGINASLSTGKIQLERWQFILSLLLCLSCTSNFFTADLLVCLQVVKTWKKCHALLKHERHSIALACLCMCKKMVIGYRIRVTMIFCASQSRLDRPRPAFHDKAQNIQAENLNLRLQVLNVKNRG